MHTGFVYLITNNVNNLVYVGETLSTINDRWSSHRAKARIAKRSSWKRSRGAPITVAMANIGHLHFRITVLQYVFAESKDRLKLLLEENEAVWINYFDALNPTCGYNRRINPFMSGLKRKGVLLSWLARLENLRSA